MATAVETYTNEIAREFRFLATWPLAASMDLGAIGQFRGDHLFEQISALVHFGIAVTTDESPYDSDKLTYASKGGTSFSLGAGAAMPTASTGGVATATATLEVKFSREYGVIFRASDLHSTRVSNEPALARAVLPLVSSHQWERDWYVVTQVLTAASTTVMIANSDSASVELAVHGEVTAGGLDVLDAKFSPQVTSQHDMHTIMINGSRATPLFRAKRVKRRFFSRRPELKAGYAVDDAQLQSAEDNPDELFDDIVVYDSL